MDSSSRSAGKFRLLDRGAAALWVTATLLMVGFAYWMPSAILDDAGVALLVVAYVALLIAIWAGTRRVALGWAAVALIGGVSGLFATLWLISEPLDSLKLGPYEATNALPVAVAAGFLTCAVRLLRPSGAGPGMHRSVRLVLAALASVAGVALAAAGLWALGASPDEYTSDFIGSSIIWPTVMPALVSTWGTLAIWLVARNRPSEQALQPDAPELAHNDAE